MKVTITRNSNFFNVEFEEKLAEVLTFDEMLGLVASLTMPEPRPCLLWLKTEQEREAWANQVRDMESKLSTIAPDPVLIGVEKND